MHNAAHTHHSVDQTGPYRREEDHFRVIRAEDIDWRAFSGFPPAARIAILVGELTKPAPYVIRVKVPQGMKLMPHRHREDRIYTVISGVFYIGRGEKFDENQLVAHSPGTVLVLPGGQPHFHWAKSGEYITQVSAIGPLGIEYVDGSDDPRNSQESRA